MTQSTIQTVFSPIRRLHRWAGPAVMMLALAHTGFAQSNACDLDASGSVNVVDVNRAVSMALGIAPCTASVEGANTCTIITVQRVVNTALGQPCAVYNSVSHTVSLTWGASPTSGITGYNVYRRTTPTGTRTKLNSALNTTTTFTDSAIQLGQTYYYTATAVASDGTESSESVQAIATIPVS